MFGDDLDQLTQTAQVATSAMAASPELAAVSNGMSSSAEMTIKPDAQRLMDLGLSARTVGNAVRAAYQGTVAGHRTEPDGKERDVRVRLPDALRYTTDAVADLPLIRRAQAQLGLALPGNGAAMLTVRQVATQTVEEKPTRITRVNRQRVAVIGAEPNGVRSARPPTLPPRPSTR